MLQERLLSPRILHFCRRQLIWECSHTRASESFPDGVAPTWLRVLPAQIPLHKQAYGDDEFLKVWADVVRRYTMSQLTYKSDVLPALMGIARHLQELTGATYLAGIFKPGAYFEAHLAWKCVWPEAPRSAPPRAPSWSWASIDNPVVLSPAQTANPMWGESVLIEMKSKVRILDAQVTPSPTDPLRVFTGTLLVEGLVIRASFNSSRKELAIDGKPLVMKLFFDEPFAEDREVFILPLLVLPAFHFDIEEGTDHHIYVHLILAVTDVEAGTYTRVGLGHFEFENSEWNEDPRMTGIFTETKSTDDSGPILAESMSRQPRVRIHII